MSKKSILKTYYVLLIPLVIMAILTICGVVEINVFLHSCLGVLIGMLILILVTILIVETGKVIKAYVQEIVSSSFITGVVDDGCSIKVYLDEGAYLPERAHENDAGFDLFSREEVTINPGEFYTFDTGVHIEIPHGYDGEIESKSGLWQKHHIFTVGTIDVHYTGTMKITLANIGDHPHTFQKGDKITQLVLYLVSEKKIKQVYNINELDAGDRGDAGFGSSGR